MVWGWPTKIIWYFWRQKKTVKINFLFGASPKTTKINYASWKTLCFCTDFLYSKPFQVTTIVLEENDLLSLAHEKLAKIDFTIHPLTICSLYNYLCSQIQIEDMLKLYLMTNLMVTLWVTFLNISKTIVNQSRKSKSISVCFFLKKCWGVHWSSNKVTKIFIIRYWGFVWYNFCLLQKQLVCETSCWEKLTVAQEVAPKALVLVVGRWASGGKSKQYLGWIAPINGWHFPLM
jgi:hypothetical protein